MEWADVIVVMEKYHRNVICEHFPNWNEKKPVLSRCIEDIYDYMQPELIALLRQKFEDVWQRGLLV